MMGHRGLTAYAADGLRPPLIQTVRPSLDVDMAKVLNQLLNLKLTISPNSGTTRCATE
jgi:hypothetical protein